LQANTRKKVCQWTSSLLTSSTGRRKESGSLIRRIGLILASAPLHFLQRPASQHSLRFDKSNANLFLIYADAMIAELHTLGIELMGVDLANS
jgi:hypothetical protein